MKRKFKQFGIMALVIMLLASSLPSNLLLVKAATTPAAFSLPALTGNQRIDAANIAKSQVGYKEAGSNLNAYGKELGHDGLEWCAYFAIWCVMKAGVEERPTTGSTTANVTWFQNRGRWHNKQSVPWSYNGHGCNGSVDGYVPQVGDFVAIDNNGSASDGPEHTAFVVAVDASWVYTVEGNISQSVVERKYSRSNWRLNGSSSTSVFISGFGSINYKEPDVTPAAKTLPAMTGDERTDAANIARSQIGYVAGSNNLNIYGKDLGQNGVAWGAYFALWCLDKAGVDERPTTASTTANVTWFQDRGLWHNKQSQAWSYNGHGCNGVVDTNYVPKIGDIIAIENNGSASDGPENTGFVIAVDDAWIYTAEGNISQSVVERKYSKTNFLLNGTDSSVYINGFGSIEYDTILVTGISLNKTSTTLNVGESENLTATVSPTNATNKNITWSSSNTNVVTVSGGTITAKSAGTATITATAADGSGKTVTCTVTVKQPVTGLSLNKTSTTLNVGATESLTVTVSPTGATNKNVTWSSSNTNVVTVSGGTITAKSAGTATITATAADGSGKTATCTVTVKQPVTGLSLNKTSTTLNVGATETLTLTVSPSNATNKSVTWSSSNTNVATVSGGTITAVSAGTATITVTAADGYGKSANCTVTVKANEQVTWPEHVKLRDNSFYAQIKGTGTNAFLNNVSNSVIGLRQVKDDNGWWYFELQDDGSYEIKSKANEYNLTLKNGEDYNGNIIYLEQDNDSAEQRWYIYGDESIGYCLRPSCSASGTFDMHSGDAQLYTYGKGNEQNFHIIMDIGWTTCVEYCPYADYTGNPITPWFRVTTDGNPENTLLENTDYTVSYANNVNIGTGSIVITGIGKYAGSRTIEFEIAVVEVESVKLSMSNMTLRDIGFQHELSFTISPSYVVAESITWTSSDTSVATVKDGVVTAVAPGSVVITVNVEGKTASCTVTVTADTKGIALNKNTLNFIDTGLSETLTYTITPAGATVQNVTWSSSNTDVATVSNGVVTAVGPGSAVITVNVDGKITQCSVTVSKPVTGISLNATSLNLKIGESVIVTAEIMPANASDKTISWAISDTSVAKVENGKVTALSVGTTVLTAITNNGKVASCIINVAEAGTTITLGDVAAGSWQYEFAQYAYEKGIMTGKGYDASGNIIFDPDGALTREQFAQILYNKEGNPSIVYSGLFVDVKPNKWYASAVLWAAEQKIVSGYGNGVFGVEDNITREQLAVMLYQYAEIKGYDVSVRASLGAFTDAYKCSYWAEEQIRWAVANGIMSGKGETLDPLGGATRAECAAMLKNFMDKFGE